MVGTIPRLDAGSFREHAALLAFTALNLPKWLIFSVKRLGSAPPIVQLLL
jgi:hypothetical protein